MPLFFLGMLPIVMTGVYAAHQIKCDIEKKKNIKQGTGKPKTVHSSDSVPKYSEKVSFYLNSSNRDMQEAITLVSKGDELEIEYDVSKRKFVFHYNYIEIGYAPSKYNNLLSSISDYKARITEFYYYSDYGGTSVKIELSYCK